MDQSLLLPEGIEEHFVEVMKRVAKESVVRYRPISDVTGRSALFFLFINLPKKDPKDSLTSQITCRGELTDDNKWETLESIKIEWMEKLLRATLWKGYYELSRPKKDNLDELETVRIYLDVEKYDQISVPSNEDLKAALGIVDLNGLINKEHMLSMHAQILGKVNDKEEEIIAAEDMADIAVD